MQKGRSDIVALLLRLGADVAAQSFSCTARNMALMQCRHGVIAVIDEHLRTKLHAQLVDFCIALHAADLPVLVLLECFAWTSSTTYAAQHVELPLDLQWQIAKHVRDRLRK